jgi:2,6-dihydroxypseudooxynicotine hydrolase
VTAAPPADRVRIAASHWKPRFVANGIDANDFDRVLDETTDWGDWAPNWRRVGDEHRALADEASRRGHMVTAAAAYQRAAWCYHLGKFLWFEDDDLHDALRESTVATYAKAMPHLDPPGERIEAPFDGSPLAANLRRPPDAERPPLVILGHGLGGTREHGLEPFAQRFADAGIAALASPTGTSATAAASLGSCSTSSASSATGRQRSPMRATSTGSTTSGSRCGGPRSAAVM